MEKWNGDGDLMHRDNWIEACQNGSFIDYDGIGTPALWYNGDYWLFDTDILPSEWGALPPTASHVVWYNR